MSESNGSGSPTITKISATITSAQASTSTADRDPLNYGPSRIVRTTVAAGVIVGGIAAILLFLKVRAFPERRFRSSQTQVGSLMVLRSPKRSDTGSGCTGKRSSTARCKQSSGPTPTRWQPGPTPRASRRRIPVGSPGGRRGAFSDARTGQGRPEEAKGVS